MLEGDFFYITELETNEALTKAMLRFEAGHPIFSGHFPDQPVVPGVCLMQTVKEIAERVLGKDLLLIRADYLKFLAFVVPEENKVLRMNVKIHPRENGEIGVDAELLDGLAPCFKFRGVFV